MGNTLAWDPARLVLPMGISQALSHGKHLPHALGHPEEETSQRQHPKSFSCQGGEPEGGLGGKGDLEVHPVPPPCPGLDQLPLERGRECDAPMPRLGCCWAAGTELPRLWLLLEGRGSGKPKFLPGLLLQHSLLEGITVTPGPSGGAGSGQGSLRGARMCPWHIPLPPLLLYTWKASRTPTAHSGRTRSPPHLRVPGTKQQQLPAATVAFPGTRKSPPAPRLARGGATWHRAELSPSRASPPRGCRAQAAQPAAGWEAAKPAPCGLNPISCPPL